MNNVKQIMKKPITIEDSASLFKAMTHMTNSKISRLLTTNNSGNIVGIITEKDIGFFLLVNDSEKNLTEIPVSDVAKHLIQVNESTPVEDVAHIMNTKNIGSVGVSSSDTVGIVTKTDLTRYYIQNYVGHKRVGDVMTVSYSSMYLDDPIYKIVSKMIEDKVSRLIIKNNENKAKGVVTFGDLFRVSMTMGKDDDVLDNSDPLISVVFPRKGFLNPSGFGGTILAKDVMTSNIVSIDYNDDLVMACTEMIDSNINGVGVLINDQLSGIVSKTDVVKALAELK
ncbi:MAG: CBS domain-containing protein [Thermoproteota archaeon]|mgnify:FL=1